MVISEEDHAQIRAAVEEYRRQLVARNINDALERLFPAVYPATPESVKGLISKFIMETEPVEKDRDHVRAHRYEHQPFDRHEHFQPLDELQNQLDVFCNRRPLA